MFYAAKTSTGTIQRKGQPRLSEGELMNGTHYICLKSSVVSLTLCPPGGGPKDPQLSKSLNALK